MRASLSTNRRIILAVVAMVALAAGRATADTPDSRCTGDPVTKDKVALVIGNSYSAGDWVSGSKDARDMACVLQRVGFMVTASPESGVDLGQMRSLLTAFSNQVKSAKVAVFFFSGHGLHDPQANKNYLLPDPPSLAADQLLEVGEIVSAMNTATDPSAVRIILLDACRNNVKIFQTAPEKPPNLKGGIGKPQYPEIGSGLVVGLAALFEQPAQSGVAKPSPTNSPYTEALLNHIPEAGLPFRELLTQVLDDVRHKSGSDQTPWDEGTAGLKPDFCLRPPVKIHTRIKSAEDDLLLLIDGKEVLSKGENGTNDKVVELRAGTYDLTVKVFNQKSYRNHHAYESPEGWNYDLLLQSVDRGLDQELCDGEDVVYKDGPHHGRWFTVVKGRLDINRGTAKVTLIGPDRDVWKYPSAIDADETDQAIVARVPVKFGNLDPLAWLLNVQVDFLIGGRKNLASAAQTCADQILDDRKKADLLSRYLAALISNGPGVAEDVFEPIRTCIGKAIGREAKVWYAVEPRSPPPPRPACAGRS